MCIIAHAYKLYEIPLLSQLFSPRIILEITGNKLPSSFLYENSSLKLKRKYRKTSLQTVQIVKLSIPSPLSEMQFQDLIRTKDSLLQYVKLYGLKMYPFVYLAMTYLCMVVDVGPLLMVMTVLC